MLSKLQQCARRFPQPRTFSIFHSSDLPSACWPLLTLLIVSLEFGYHLYLAEAKLLWETGVRENIEVRFIILIPSLWSRTGGLLHLLKSQFISRQLSQQDFIIQILKTTTFLLPLQAKADNGLFKWSTHLKIVAWLCSPQVIHFA